MIKVSDPYPHLTQAHRALLALKDPYTTEEDEFINLKLVSSSWRPALASSELAKTLNELVHTSGFFFFL